MAFKTIAFEQDLEASGEETRFTGHVVVENTRCSYVLELKVPLGTQLEFSPQFRTPFRERFALIMSTPHKALDLGDSHYRQMVAALLGLAIENHYYSRVAEDVKRLTGLTVPERTYSGLTESRKHPFSSRLLKVLTEVAPPEL